MRKIRLFWKFRTKIIALLKYSFEEVPEYKYLTRTEKKIITSEKEYEEMKEMIGL